MVEMYVTDSLFLDAEKISEKVFIVHLYREEVNLDVEDRRAVF